MKDQHYVGLFFVLEKDFIYICKNKIDMGRKKKVIVEEAFTPSKYQEAIFDHIQHGVGNLVIEAAAGAGKTSTLVHAINLIPIDKKILFCAFNKDIVKELQKRIGKKENVDVRTVHSLGYAIIQRNLGGKLPPINENKYRAHIYNNIASYTSLNTYSLGKTNFLKYIDNISKLVDFCRYNLASTEREAEKLVNRHEISLMGDEIDVALKVLEWGKNDIEEVDYTDMVWLPNILFMKPYGLQYDFILGDEAQDFSIAQREILLKCQKMGTRYIFCGDKNQSIYSFASASPDTFDKLKTMPNTKTLPLSISYRCARNIVKFAQNLVPSIEHNELDERLGEVLFDLSMDVVQDGDMILCRNNAPLMEIYNELIKSGKKCQIRGKDIGMNLVKLVESTNQEFLNVNLVKDGVFARLYENLFEERDKMIVRSGLDLTSVMSSSIILNKLDMIHALEVLSEGLKTSKELTEKIKGVFSDKKIEGISLSTIHKAKGLEANNVYIAYNSLMPCKSATQDWEIEQEHNLMYVAYTRAKNRLGFLSEDEFDSKLSNSQESLAIIERQVNTVLGKQHSFIPITPKIASNIVNNIKTIEKPTIGQSTTLGTVRRQPQKLNTLIQRKLTKLK